MSQGVDTRLCLPKPLGLRLIDSSFLISMGGGAWPFLVGGVICLVNSDNERDLSLLNSGAKLLYG